MVSGSKVIFSSSKVRNIIKTSRATLAFCVKAGRPSVCLACTVLFKLTT